jgi:hypothetical protein
MSVLTLAPFFSRFLTVASPMPLAAPVTIATFPFRSMLSHRFFIAKEISFGFALWTREMMAHSEFVIDLPIILYF